MIWRKIQHPVLTYSFVVFLFSCVFCAFGMSQESYATNYDCSFTPTANTSFSPSDVCTDFPYSSTSSVPLYYYDLNFVFYHSNPSVVATFTINPPSGPYTVYNVTFNLTTSSPDFSYSSSDLFFVTPFNNSTSDYFVYPLAFSSFSQYFYYDGVFSFKISDSLSDFSGDCPVCEVCPVIPENPYDNKLDDIKKAIYVCGAILIMLYFFFCIYKIIVKDGGSR